MSESGDIPQLDLNIEVEDDDSDNDDGEVESQSKFVGEENAEFQPLAYQHESEHREHIHNYQVMAVR